MPSRHSNNWSEGIGAQAVLPVVEIKDWPALAYRGVMVDMSHGALPTEQEVERQLEFLAKLENQPVLLLQRGEYRAQGISSHQSGRPILAG